MGCSVCSAVYFFLSFLMTKFYLNFRRLVGFYNTFALFGALGLGSLVYFYYNLPETENKTLKDIAAYFAREPRTEKRPENPKDGTRTTAGTDDKTDVVQTQPCRDRCRPDTTFTTRASDDNGTSAAIALPC